MHQENFLISELRIPVLTGQTRSENWRRLQIKKVKELIEQHEEQILFALSQDLGKPPTEAFFEIIALRQELQLVEKELANWMRSRTVRVPLTFKPGKASVKLEPLGCVLIIGPWNYPFSLILQPLISALAAGNTAVIKPSEQAPYTSELIAKLIPQHFPPDIVKVFEGGSDVAKALLEEPFDHIFFTGGESIGKKVLAAAANNLTPVTLELGGRSPAIVIKGADIGVTAKRLIWGKGLNAGQTCIAPNHLLVTPEIETNLINHMKEAIKEFYGINPLQSPHLGKIINQHHFSRLCKLLNCAKQKQQILYGGKVNDKDFRIEPTLLKVDNPNDPLLEEEIFGPLFPIITVPNFESALNKVRKQPIPLALYMFGGTESQRERLLNSTSSGSVCFNDVVMQAGIPELPFGGKGNSGMGRYHGLSGFETFSHHKSVLHRPFWLDLKFRYPPYKLNLDLLKKLMS